jgi:hypothetical protein
MAYIDPALMALMAQLIGPSEADRRYWRQMTSEACRRAFEAGVARGRELEGTERDAAWIEIARPAARGGPSFADLELKRWGPAGREHFGDPKPGDFPGRAATRRQPAA